MIAQYKPNTSQLTAASAMLVLALGCLTFTSAAEKTPPTAATPAANEPDLDKQLHHRLKILEEELARRNQEVTRKQADLDQLKEKLQISDEDAAQSRAADDVVWCRRLDFLRVEAEAEFIRIDALYDHLTQLSRADLKKAALTVVHDQVLSGLLDRYASTEEKLAGLSDAYGKEHPEVRQARAILETIDRQIEQRLDGILMGIKTKRASEKATLDSLQAQVEKARKSGIETGIKRREYFQAKRDLETLQTIRERLTMRIIQEKVDAAIPKQP